MLLIVSVPEHKLKWIFGISGESDDDREDIFAAANSARKAASTPPSICLLFQVKFYCHKFPSNYKYLFVDLACSGNFWKKMDHIFAAVNADDMQNMMDQVIIKILQ